MRLMAGYTFHSWELLGMWAWTPAFIAACLAVSGLASVRSVEIGSYITAAFHLTGLVASSTMGTLSDRTGRRSVLFSMALTSTLRRPVRSDRRPIVEEAMSPVRWKAAVT